MCLLVMVCVRADGTKELVALDDGHRESTESWADLLRSCKRRGMRAPVLAVGDGALGFWAALREAFPETREQRCWFHKIANVLNALPKSAQSGAKAALAEIWNAEDREHAEKAARAFVADYGTKWPKAAAKITDDLDVLLADFTNTTGDQTFDGTLRQALAIKLGETPFLTLFPQSSVGETLRRMERQPNERLGAELGGEVCRRRGLKAMLSGSIAPLGSHYVVTVHATNCTQHIVQLLTQDVTSKRDLPVLGEHLDGSCVFHFVPKLRTHTLLELKIRRRRCTPAP